MHWIFFVKRRFSLFVLRHSIRHVEVHSVHRQYKQSVPLASIRMLTNIAFQGSVDSVDGIVYCNLHEFSCNQQ